MAALMRRLTLRNSSAPAVHLRMAHLLSQRRCSSVPRDTRCSCLHPRVNTSPPHTLSPCCLSTRVDTHTQRGRHQSMTMSSCRPQCRIDRRDTSGSCWTPRQSTAPRDTVRCSHSMPVPPPHRIDQGHSVDRCWSCTPRCTVRPGTVETRWCCCQAYMYSLVHSPHLQQRNGMSDEGATCQCHRMRMLALTVFGRHSHVFICRSRLESEVIVAQIEIEQGSAQNNGSTAGCGVQITMTDTPVYSSERTSDPTLPSRAQCH
jgi:hypothetical protein